LFLASLLSPWATICHHTISLDGFVAGPDDSMDWAFAYGEPTSVGDETMTRLGAIVAGRRWHQLEGALGRRRRIYGGHWDGRVFVLTHRPDGDPGDPRRSFVSEGIERAVATAQEAAGERDVGIFGGSLTQQCLDAGLLHEIVLHIAPVLLGSGVRLFGDGGAEQVELERVSVGEADQLTDLHFRVRR
jgi:dihydrofolate reductase